MKVKKLDYQSHDNGYSWRIIQEWTFSRTIAENVLISGLYKGKKNFWIGAKLINGKLILNNPKNIRVPKYALAVALDMLNQVKPL